MLSKNCETGVYWHMRRSGTCCSVTTVLSASKWFQLFDRPQHLSLLPTSCPSDRAPTSPPRPRSTGCSRNSHQQGVTESGNHPPSIWHNINATWTIHRLFRKWANKNPKIITSANKCKEKIYKTTHWYDFSFNYQMHCCSNEYGYHALCLQCFDAVGWAAGMASGL